MAPRRNAHHHLHVLVSAMLLTFALAGCVSNSPTIISTNTPDVLVETTPTPFKTKAELPPTWTATPPAGGKEIPATRTPIPTRDYHATMIAQTTVAAGVHCQRNPDAWQVFSGPISAYAGWCQIVGTPYTLYEYKMLSPDGWIVNTFGELTPNLVFSTGHKNVYVKVYQAFSYFNRNYSGTLEDAPEKASICDENDICTGFIDPLETLIRQEMKTIQNREILVLDSTVGALQIRRYYQIIPFNIAKHLSDRLFIVEFVSLDTALDAQQYAKIIADLEMMVASINPR
jgi:hypothetical protein